MASVVVFKKTSRYLIVGLGSILDTYKYRDTLIVLYRYFAVFDTSRYRTSVLRYVGTSVRRYVGTSIRRYVGTSVRRYVGTSVRRYVGTSVLRYFDTSILRYFDTSIFLQT